MKPLPLGIVCLGLALLVPAGLAAQNHEQEIDAGKILWQSTANAEKYFGKIVKVLPPRIPAEGWEHQYRDGTATVGTKTLVLMLVYRYKEKPKSIKEALRKVGLPTEIPPLDVRTSFMWPARGWTTRPLTFKGRTLNRVVLVRDLSEITIDGHEPGTY